VRQADAKLRKPDCGRSGSPRHNFRTGVSQRVVPNNSLDHYQALPDGVLIHSRKAALRDRAPLCNFGPRFGFAYQVNSKLVVRGGKVAGGWTVSGATGIQGVSPITIADPTAGTLFGTNGVSGAGFGRAQIAPGMACADIATPGSVKERLDGASGGQGWFNKSAFIAPPERSPAGTIYHSTTAASGQAQCATASSGITCDTPFGNSGTGILKGPGQLNLELSIVKTTRVHTLQFRAEFFNACKHAQFSNPNFAPGAVCGLPNFAAFGQITSTSVNPRIIQLALKYMF
jgi:hypothetical protein